MNPNPLVSIQIPTYNQQQYIKEAVDSVLAQTYKNLQVIVSDDCSPDYNIFEYLKDNINHPNTLIHRNKINKGRVKNYHDTLYNLVEGKYFMNLDGDDYFINNDFIEYGVQKLNESLNYEPLMFQGNHDIKKIKNIFPNHIHLDEETVLIKSNEFLKNWHLINTFSHATTIYNTEKAKQSNFYDFDCIFADFYSTAKLWSFESYVLLSSKKVAFWRNHGKNATFDLDEDAFDNEINAINLMENVITDRLKKNSVDILVSFLKKKIFNAVILSFKKNKKTTKQQLAFFIKNNKYSIMFPKIFLRFLLKN